jgi:hypothetical protein
VTVCLHTASRSIVVILAATALLAPGCASLGRPDWLDPGPARNQQRRAVRFDPYMQDDIGPYAFRQYGIMDGSRPRDYSEPVPEVKRSRWWSPTQ